MKLTRPCFVFLLCTICCCNTKKHIIPGKRTVEIVQSGGQFRLYRNGRPYTIKGICALDAKYLRQAKESGANSIRTYNTDHAGEILDSAAKLGLTVTLGIQLPYASVEMNYRNQKAVAQQIEKVRKEVLKYKDHPALLMWGIGNELSLYINGAAVSQHIALLQAIKKMAEMIHDIDPNHPTTTTLPYIRQYTISAMDMFCTSLDVISINSFEELRGLPARAKHYNKPYIISEYGANGYWLTAQTAWNTQIEQTSQEKCAFIIRQSRVIQLDTGRCLGSYAFIWGHKLEYSTSWFSLFTEDGEATQVVDALQYTWTGKWPDHPAPAIYSIAINNHTGAGNMYLHPGEKFMTGITIGNTDTTGLYVTGQLQQDDLEVAELYAQANYKQKESYNYIPGNEPLPVRYDKVFENGKPVNRINMQLQAPAAPGPYRLFVYLHNHHNRVATANACFYVHD